jgi:hypothetical protein
VSVWLLFLAGTLAVLAGLNVYVYRRVVSALRLGRTGRVVTGLCIVAGLVAMIVGRRAGSALPDGTAEAVAVFGFTVELGVVLGAVLLLPVDLVRFGHYVARRRQAPGPDRAEEPGATEGGLDTGLEDPSPQDGSEPAHLRASGPPDDGPRDAGEPSPRATSVSGRRELLVRAASGAALLGGGGVSLYGALIGRHAYVTEEVPVKLPGLSPGLDGYTIVQLSDLHFGTFVDDRELRDAEELVRHAKPDLVVLTGDLVDHDPSYAPFLGRLVERLVPLSRDGVAAIPGNHDYYAGIDTVLATLRRAGAHVLRNDGRAVGTGRHRFALLGVDDVWSPRYGLGDGPDLDRALRMAPNDVPRVLLCHNPEFFPKAAGRVDLQLSGHTHGGQVNVLTRKPAELVLPYGYVAGRYDRDGSQLYVNRGFGVAGPPTRIGSAPEVTRIVLTA